MQVASADGSTPVLPRRRRGRARGKSTGDSYTSRDAAAALGVSPRTLEKWRQTGFGPVYYKAGTAVRYRIAIVLAWIKEREASSTSETKRYEPGAR